MLIDSHTHLQFPQFDKDRDEVIKRALDNAIWLVNVGADKESSIKAVELANKYKEGVYATVGVHPHEADKNWDYEFFKKLAHEPKVVAIGECGLENSKLKNQNSKLQLKNQKELFVKQIELAKEINKPLMIHCRDAFPDLIRIPITHNSLLNTSPGIVHFFTGSLEDTKKLLAMGFYFTFGGLITFNRSFDEIIKFIPMEKILLETDAPYVSPAPYRGKRNEPLYIIETAKRMAKIKGVSFEEICRQTTENAGRIFGLDYNIIFR
ncbi:MAG: TatD family hydrolase [Patescibacteria group bacterium]